jgi:hypothetical protein
MPPILRMALNIPFHAAVYAPNLPPAGVQAKTADSATKSAPESTDHRIECSARSRPANGNL